MFSDGDLAVVQYSQLRAADVIVQNSVYLSPVDGRSPGTQIANGVVVLITSVCRRDVANSVYAEVLCEGNIGLIHRVHLKVP